MNNENRKIKGNIFYYFVKRCFDFLTSFIALSILLLPMIILAIIVKCGSKGPVLFKDKRIGKNGKLISVYKFRTMYIDAEENIDKYLTPEQKETWLRERKIDNDPRITKNGKFLRKTSLDELPQLLNIFVGSLSIVGPRPISQKEMDTNYTEEEKKLLTSAKPGLTGYWQVYGRGEIEYKTGERQKMELEYLYHRGIFFDLKLMFLTIPAVFKGKGAK